jgi:phosphatidylserine decarboxylase
MEMLKIITPPINREGYPFILLAVFVTMAACIVNATIGLLCFIVTLWVAFFFRDPIRMVPDKEGALVSPADGMVQLITDVIPPAELELGDEIRTRVSIFLNVFDVHVNRVPAAGTISHIYYHPGKFLNASLDKASEDNERNLVKMTLANGVEVGFVQIAGLVARRIVCQVVPGQIMKAGERFGLIRFGSRVDIYLPPGVAPTVAIGQRVIGGETIIADLENRIPATATAI